MLRARLVLALLPALSGLALAEGNPPPIGPNTLAVFPRGEERCYRATFESLKKGQILRSFQLYHLLRPNPIKEVIDAPLNEAVDADQRSTAENWTDVVARLEGKTGLYAQTVVCNDDEQGKNLHCYVECDGGSFGAVPSDSAMGIAFEAGNGLSLNASCGDPDEEGHDHFLTAKEAGDGFTLKREPPESCVADDQAARPTFAADPVPLRTRIADKGWTCLARTYDAAHLAKHPKQKVVAIALALTSQAAPKVDEEGWRNTAFTAALSLKLRDGTSASQNMECVADDYQFRCGGAFRLRRKDDASALLLMGEYGGEDAGTPEPILGMGLKLGADDMTFRLDGTADSACRAQ